MAVIDRLIKCMKCDHHQVAERALAVWSEDSMELLSDQDRRHIWSKLYIAFHAVCHIIILFHSYIFLMLSIE